MVPAAAVESRYQTRKTGEGSFSASGGCDSNSVELERTRTNSCAAEKREKIFENSMNYEEWSKLVELDRTLTPKFASRYAEHKRRALNTKSAKDTKGKEGKKMIKLAKLTNFKSGKSLRNREHDQLGQPYSRISMKLLCGSGGPRRLDPPYRKQPQ